jgi:hypothetical protein
MSIDFSEIKDWRQFEDLVCDLLEKEEFYIEERAGIGPDEGRDILVLGYFANSLERIERRYLVSCKYWNKPVPEAKVTDIRDKMDQHKAQGFLFVAFDITSGLQKKLDGMKGEIPVRYWLKRDIENRLIQHKDIFRKYLPLSFERFFGVEGLIPEAELIMLFNKRYGRNPRLDELISWRKDTVNYGITDISEIEKILDNDQTQKILDLLYEKYLNRKVDPVGHLSWGYLYYRQPTEETKRTIEWHIRNSPEYMSRTRIVYWPTGLPKTEIHFQGLLPQRIYGWRPYHTAYAKGILRVVPDSFPPCIELESSEDQEFRIEWSLGRNLLNKNTIAIDVAHDGLFQLFIFVVATNNRPYYIQYIFDEGEAKRVNDSGVGYAQYFVGREFSLNADMPKTLERNFSQDLMGLYQTEVGVLLSLHFGVKGKAKISRILLAE